MGRWVHAGIVIALGLAGCLRTPVHHCDGPEDCPGGMCAVTEAGDMRCTVESADCDSEVEWADDAGDLAGVCIDPEVTAPAAVCLAHPVELPEDSCATIVCTDQPRCCTHEWGEACVRAAERVCDAACGSVAAFFGDGLLWVGAWDGAAFAPFWTEDDAAGTFYLAAAWGDVDGDLAPELAVCGTIAGAPSVTVYQNEGAGFTAGTPVDITTYCRDLDFVDLDADGDLDLVVAGEPNILVLDRSGSDWVSRSAGISPGDSTDVDWADVDGDDRLDVAVAHFETTVQVFRNGTGGFQMLYESADISELLGFSDVAWAELDDVEGIDLFIAGDYELKVVPDSPDAGFMLDEAATSLIGPQSGAEESAQLIDGDGDGDLDVIAFYNQAPAEMFENYREMGDGFGATPWWTSPTEPFNVDAWTVRSAVGDVDGDGIHDVVACGHMNPCHLWLGDGAGTLVEEDGGAPGDILLYGVELTGDWR